jgi:S1-C subfamily serine protease
MDLPPDPGPAAPPPARPSWLPNRHAATALGVGVLLIVGVVMLAAQFSGPSDPLPAPEGAPPAAVKDAAKPGPAEPAAALKPDEVFDKYAQAVPLVEAVAAGHGSGFLVEHGGKYLVLTNRHVIADAYDGVDVHFLRGRGGSEKRFTIPGATVAAVHKEADLAAIELGDSAEDLRKLGVAPVRLAPPGHRPRVGENIYAIGHPSDATGKALTQTLTSGIVSAVGREYDGCRFLQVNAAINPGNSGGPLFDDQGRVVGVNTMGSRLGSDGRILEGQGFALEMPHVHELLADKEKSLSAREIKALMAPPELTDAMKQHMDRRLARLVDGEGYQFLTGRAATSVRVLKIGGRYGRQMEEIPVRLAAGRPFVVVTCSNGPDALRLLLADEGGTVLEAKKAANPEITFRPTAAGTFRLAVENRSGEPATVVVAVLDKGGPK